MAVDDLTVLVVVCWGCQYVADAWVRMHDCHVRSVFTTAKPEAAEGASGAYPELVPAVPKPRLIKDAQVGGLHPGAPCTWHALTLWCG